jgi:outer membrane protein TolC
MKKRAALAVVVAVLTGCTLEPHYTRPDPAVSAQWPDIANNYPQSGAAASGVPARSDTSTVRAADIGWREFFTDPRLQKLIETALQRARSIRSSARTYSQKSQRLRASRSKNFPRPLLRSQLRAAPAGSAAPQARQDPALSVSSTSESALRPMSSTCSAASAASTTHGFNNT